MRFISKLGAITAGLCVSVLWVGSADANGGVNAREHRQRARIAAGIEDGSINRREARRLTREQAKIERTERRFRHNDGRLGPRERRRLDRLQDRSSVRIRRARHN